MTRSQQHRRCHHCRQLFLPDPRSRNRQNFCMDAPCRKSSKLRSQQRWKSKPENQNYWRGPEEVKRVRVWRKANPQYWKRVRRRRGTLQDDCGAEEPVGQRARRGSTTTALQDDWIPDDPLLVGIVATLAGSALQEDIATMCRSLVAKGRDVLRSRTTVGTVSSGLRPSNRD